MEKTKMAFFIALIIAGAGLEVIVPTFIVSMIVWYAMFIESDIAE